MLCQYSPAQPVQPVALYQVLFFICLFGVHAQVISGFCLGSVDDYQPWRSSEPILQRQSDCNFGSPHGITLASLLDKCLACVQHFFEMIREPFPSTFPLKQGRFHVFICQHVDFHKETQSLYALLLALGLSAGGSHGSSCNAFLLQVTALSRLL